MKSGKTKRKYFRKCGCCNRKFEQSEMVRTEESLNGWLCWDCLLEYSPNYEEF